ncbi:MAG TPA: ABC transporter ATP-binding protein [Planctomycetaceae bacterium]|nr:ABC transporter ATP-binding protein [Planctomycetaceae bacterium]
MKAAPSIVACECIEKSFGKGQTRTRVLRGATFAAWEGELTYIVGPSGCGKTTLISVAGGLLTPDKGIVSVCGTELTRLPSQKLADFRLKNIGFVFQQFNLLPSLSAVENAAIPLVAQGESYGKAARRARSLLNDLGIESEATKRPSQLSGGQQQRVAIARALIHNPRVLICDEPTASLDASSGKVVMELLREKAVEPGRAVVVVTHDDRIFPLADRIAEMADGIVKN